MNILAVDTALGACSAALMADDRVLAHQYVEMQRGHAEALAPMVQTLMQQAGFVLSALDRIAVTTGPGTFTGQRVGLAFARALGLALKKPVIGITTLDAMAEQALAEVAHAPWAIAAADAKRGEIYLGVRSVGSTLLAPELIALPLIAARVAGLAETHGHAVTLAGTAAGAVMPLLQASGLQPLDSLVRQPDAIFVGRLAYDAAPGMPPKPLYLRPPDAKLPRQS